MNWSFLTENFLHFLLLFILIIVRKQLREILSSIAEALRSFCNISSRAKSFQYKGMSIDLNTGVMPMDQQTPRENKNHALLKAHQNHFITANEKAIKDTLEAANLNDAQANDILINHLAHAYFNNKMLEVAHLIFEEQVKLLTHLNFSKKGCAENELYQFYSEWLERNNPDYSFDNFLGFMLKNGLVNQNMDGYWIAPLGIEFLAYCIRIGRQIN